jgi:hypothetical protein
MNIVLQKDVAGLGALLRLSLPSTAVAAGSGDATTVTGVTVDRFSLGAGSMPSVAAMGVAYEATLASGATIKFGYAVQDSADGSTWADYQTATYATANTGPTGGGAVSGVFDIGSVNLSSARRYIRLNYIPDLSAGATDTAVCRAIGFAAGFDRLPN